MRLGELLITQGLIRSDQLDTALREQARSRRFLGDILVALGFVKEADLYPVLAQILGYPYLSQTGHTPLNIHPDGWGEIETIPALKIATSDPDNLFLQHKWRQFYGRDPDAIFLASPGQLVKEQSLEENSGQTAPDLFKSLMIQAISLTASDVHFTPSPHHCQIYLRVDGVLTSFQTIHKDQWQNLCAHIKVLGHMDLAENRRPQDGSFRFQHKFPVDCRLSIMPTKAGESLVIRILDPRSVIHGLDQLGLSFNQAAELTRVSHMPSGLFVITGPTGSGKTTTLYAMLSAIAGQGRNVMTLEQPIEYRLDDIRQTEVHPDITSFADALRAILRHDPDVIYVSEIRDEQTALTAVRAAMTGHLVLTTLHVNDVRLIPQRLEDLGVPASYLKGVLTGAMAQRLVRRVCCQTGCEACLQTGYAGRHVVAEVFARGHDLSQQYVNYPQERMSVHAHKLIAQGITTLSELDRVLGEQELAHVA